MNMILRRMLTRTMMIMRKKRRTRKSENHVSGRERRLLYNQDDGLQQQSPMVYPRLLKPRNLGNHVKAMLAKFKRIQMNVQCLVNPSRRKVLIYRGIVR
jgi:hypothetical protein